jgi:hypothetical protein
MLAPRWPPVQLTLLDRQDIVTPATLAGFAELGWAARVQVDRCAGVGGPADDAAPTRCRRRAGT